MPKMPTLGPRQTSPVLRKLATLVLVASAAAAAYYGYRQRAVTSVPETPSPSLTEVGPPPSGPIAVAAPAAPPLPPKLAGPRFVSVSVNGPIETALASAVGTQIAPALTQVVMRTLVWWLAVPSDLRRGDKLDILYEERPGEEPLVHAVQLTSAKFAKTFRAYRFKPEGEGFFRYFQPGGEQLELRLAQTPLDEYEQITSLIRDGRHHKGVDFRTPVGTPVRATLAGTVTRRNWNWRSNGNCLEITESAPPYRHTIFLHMSELSKAMQLGTAVSRGMVLGSSGNSGHSFAPHLHYQLMSAMEQVLDPFDGATVRRQLTSAQRTLLDGEISRLDGLMGVPLAGK